MNDWCLLTLGGAQQPVAGGHHQLLWAVAAHLAATNACTHKSQWQQQGGGEQ